MAESTIRWEQDDDAVVILTLDDPNQSANTMNAAYKASMAATLDRLEAEKDAIAGVVITSAKKTFFAGGNLNDLVAVRPETADAFAADVRELNGQLRRLEKLGRPVVAAINGAALGGGLEICLACHHRIAVDAASIKIGFPEVTLGLLPGGGGVVRSVRLLGVVPALTDVLLEGKRHSAAKAAELGLVDEVVATADDLMSAAKAWIAANPEAAQPWDRGDRIPGGTPASADLARQLPALPARLSKQLKGANYPAPKAILAAAVEGAQVDFDSAVDIERRYFISLVTSQVAKNMIQAFFFDMQAVNNRAGRPAELEPRQVAKVVVLGAGMMGAAIAFVCAQAGIEVMLKDVSLEAAERGKGYAERLVAKGRADAAVLERITPTADPEDAAGADCVIEAVFEDPALKARVFAEIEPHLAEDALLGSNTSTLPITGLAEGVARPEDFIGLHFFSPVDRMPLIEIIAGAQTSEATRWRALDLARQIRKTPIVVNDARGFFTSRVILPFIMEGMSMLAEGIPPASIEQASAQAGYPAPVLQLSDELNVNLMRKVRHETRVAVEAAGGTWTHHAADDVMQQMVDDFQRAGRLAGAGFYDYADGRRAGLWPGLAEHFGGNNRTFELRDLKERMLFIEALEAIKCLDEGVLTSVADANVGSILGIGFPGWTGGVLQYVSGYAGGLAGFVERAHDLADRYGERFLPPASLVEMAERGDTYNDAAVPQVA